jgi:ribonucleoside-diphosphate reductase alpha chain
LTGKTYNIDTPVGKAFITINENGGDQPFEAFINTAKAGSEIAAVSEAIGRLISYILRMASPIAPLDRLREVVVQLIGIGGGRSLGFGHQPRALPARWHRTGAWTSTCARRTASLTEEVKSQTPFRNGGNGGGTPCRTRSRDEKMKIGDLCPECGEAAVVNEEGCRKCYACGYSEC